MHARNLEVERQRVNGPQSVLHEGRTLSTPRRVGAMHAEQQLGGGDRRDTDFLVLREIEGEAQSLSLNQDRGVEERAHGSVGRSPAAARMTAMSAANSGSGVGPL